MESTIPSPMNVSLLLDGSPSTISSPLHYIYSPEPNYAKLKELYPWITEFSNLCQAKIGLTDMTVLEKLMSIYFDHVSSSVTDCYLKPNRAAKLKRIVYDKMMLFRYFYTDIKQPLEHSSYLDKMSYLMAMYIDLEIIASRRSKEYISEIASKITSTLFLFLEHSQDHILDAVLNAKYVNKKFCELCNLILERVLRDSPGRAVYELTYVRYILAYKLWKRIVKGPNERRRVAGLAVVKLHAPNQFKEKLKAGLLPGVLPTIPKQRRDITMFFMQAKFCIKERIEIFLKMVQSDKELGILSPQIVSDLNTPLFFAPVMNNCKSEPLDDQENPCGTTNLMNDIWSSISGADSGNTAQELRIASIIKKKKKHKKKHSCRLNGVNSKGVKRKILSVKKESSESEKERDIESKPSVVNLKKEEKEEVISDDEVIFVDCSGPPILDCHQIDDDSESIKNDNTEVEISEPSITSSFGTVTREISSPAVYDPLFNAELIGSDLSERIIIECQIPPSKELLEEVWKYEEFSNEDFSERSFLEALSYDSQRELYSETEVVPVTNQECINEMLRSVQEHGRSSRDLRLRTENCHMPEPMLEPEEFESPDDDVYSLHKQTLRIDFDVFTKQEACQAIIKQRNASSDCVVPFPCNTVDGERCPCSQCIENYNIMLQNYKTLTEHKPR